MEKITHGNPVPTKMNGEFHGEGDREASPPPVEISTNTLIVNTKTLIFKQML